MTHIKTSTGFEIDVDKERFNDMELFDSLVKVEKGDYTELPMVVDKVLGDHKKDLYEHVRGEDGRVPINRVIQEVNEILSGSGGKNS